MRILVAEDDAVLAEAVQRSLRQSGHAVDWVQNGAQAEDAVQLIENVWRGGMRPRSRDRLPGGDVALACVNEDRRTTAAPGRHVEPVA